MMTGNRTQDTVMEAVSPPLLARSPEMVPFEPSPETSRLEILSDRTSPTKEELREVEDVIFKDDAILPLQKEKDSEFAVCH